MLLTNSIVGYRTYRIYTRAVEDEAAAALIHIFHAYFLVCALLTVTARGGRVSPEEVHHCQPLNAGTIVLVTWIDGKTDLMVKKYHIQGPHAIALEGEAIRSLQYGSLRISPLRTT